MNIPIEIYIYAAALVGCLVGFLGCFVFYGIRRAKVEKETWAAASRFYNRRYNSPESRI